MANTKDNDRSLDDVVIDPDKEARMLLNPPNESVVQFTQNQSGQSTNGQVMLPVNAGRSGVGMTKQELMKYANDPFWVRLRMFLFILFWVIWVAMLVGAIAIVAMAPGCPATASLPWWKKSSSMMEISLADSNEPDRAKYAKQTGESLSNLASKLKNVENLNIDTLIINNIDPYILIPLESDTNDTAATINDLKNQVISLAKNPKGIKVLMGLKLGQTKKSNPWYDKSKVNNTEFIDYYIWSPIMLPNISAGWEYDTDRFEYVAKSLDGDPLLNFESESLREQAKQAVLNWMKTKIEGIQINQLWMINSIDGQVKQAKSAEREVEKWVKMAGQNKAFLIVDDSRSNINEDEIVQYVTLPDASGDLTLKTMVWEELAKQSQTDALKTTLEKLFKPWVKHDSNLTDDHVFDRLEVGKNWRSLQMPHPLSNRNTISKRFGLSIAEGVVSAIQMLPRVTPSIEIDGPDQLESVSKSPLTTKLGELRRSNPETLLIGRTVLPKPENSQEVFALYRGAKNNKSYLLLINFSSTSQKISVPVAELPFQDTVVSRRIIGTDVQSNNATVGNDVNLTDIKIDPKQVLLIEFSVAE